MHLIFFCGYGCRNLQFNLIFPKEYIIKYCHFYIYQKKLHQTIAKNNLPYAAGLPISLGKLALKIALLSVFKYTGVEWKPLGLKNTWNK